MVVLAGKGMTKWPLIISFNAEFQRFCDLKVGKLAQS